MLGCQRGAMQAARSATAHLLAPSVPLNPNLCLQGGMDAVRDIRRTWPRYHTKIIAVTADAFEDTRDNCIANGFDGWLAKPFRVEEFAKVLAACRTGAALTPKRPGA